MEVILFILWLGKGKPLANILQKCFFPRIVHEIGLARRLDIVWDRYNPISAKENTRDNRDTAVGNVWRVLQKFLGQTFLKNANNNNNKKELFTYLSSMLSTEQLPRQKELYIIEDDCVKHMVEGTPVGQCNHEDADTCILVHLLHAL